MLVHFAFQTLCLLLSFPHFMILGIKLLELSVTFSLSQLYCQTSSGDKGPFKQQTANLLCSTFTFEMVSLVSKGMLEDDASLKTECTHVSLSEGLCLFIVCVHLC